jgi:hypothetical protein
MMAAMRMRMPPAWVENFNFLQNPLCHFGAFCVLRCEFQGCGGTARLFRHCLYMSGSRAEQAARLRTIAAGFRASAAQTEWPAYRDRMLEMAADLEREAARLELRIAS